MIETGTEHLHEGLGCGGDMAWAKLVEVSSRGRAEGDNVSFNPTDAEDHTF
jgi:hypothetical protein